MNISHEGTKPQRDKEEVASIIVDSVVLVELKSGEESGGCSWQAGLDVSAVASAL